MQSVVDAWSVEEIDPVRKIAEAVQVAWKKDFRSTIKFFTIGVSTIGGSDVIKSDGGVVSDWNKYLYEDESSNVLSIGYERELSQPTGGMTKALADIALDNTSGRYTPRYAGGSSAIYTAVAKPRRPLTINAGFNYGGIDNTIPQFVGITTKAPVIDSRNKRVQLQAADFIDFIQNQYVDDASMFTSQRSDVVIENILAQLGFATAQYELDTGIQIIPFGEFQVGDKFGDIIHKIVEAENGQFYQDEEGRLRFENRQHWSNYPHFNVQRVITTAQVINAETPNTDHIINVVEVRSKPRGKEPQQLVWALNSPIALAASGTTDIFVNFDDPMLAITQPTFFTANSLSDGTGTDITSNITISRFTKFTRSAKITFNNSSSTSGFLTSLNIYGRPAKTQQEIYYREQASSSVTAYEERIFSIENNYIQSSDWAKSYAEMLLQDFSSPENLQKLTIRAVPELQLGDLISWQGHYWRIFGIRTQIDPSVGFLQELSLLQRTIRTYFTIGVSTIGGPDRIAP